MRQGTPIPECFSNRDSPAPAATVAVTHLPSIPDPPLRIRPCGSCGWPGRTLNENIRALVGARIHQLQDAVFSSLSDLAWHRCHAADDRVCRSGVLLLLSRRKHASRGRNAGPQCQHRGTDGRRTSGGNPRAGRARHFGVLRFIRLDRFSGSHPAPARGQSSVAFRVCVRPERGSATDRRSLSLFRAEAQRLTRH